MPDFIHNDPEFKELLNIVSSKKEIDITLVEKDYWIMHALYSLQQQGIEFELKGGTSLSKGHSLIHRFSEDIDIHIRTNFRLLTEGKEDKTEIKEAINIFRLPNIPHCYWKTQKSEKHSELDTRPHPSFTITVNQTLMMYWHE